MIETQDIMILTLTNNQSWDWILHIQTWSTLSRFSEGINSNIKPSQFSADMSLCQLWITWKFTWEYTNLWNQIHRKEFYQHSDSEKFSFLFIQERRQAVWLKSNLPLAPLFCWSCGSPSMRPLNKGVSERFDFNQTVWYRSWYWLSYCWSRWKFFWVAICRFEC